MLPEREGDFRSNLKTADASLADCPAPPPPGQVAGPVPGLVLTDVPGKEVLLIAESVLAAPSPQRPRDGPARPGPLGPSRRRRRSQLTPIPLNAHHSGILLWAITQSDTCNYCQPDGTVTPTRVAPDALL